MSSSTAQAGPDELRECSIGDLLGSLGQDSSLLVRQEIELARTELTEKLTRAGAGIVALIVAAFMLLAALGAGVTAAIAGLTYVEPTWAAALITLGGFVMLALVLALIARGRLRAAAPLVPARALQTAKETPGELVR